MNCAPPHFWNWPSRCLCKRRDYEVEDLPAEERAVIAAQGGRITVLGHVPGKSSSDIARRILAD